VLVHGFQPEERIRVLGHFDQIGEIKGMVSDDKKGWMALRYRREEAQKRAVQFDGAFVGGGVVGVAKIQALEIAERTYRFGDQEKKERTRITRMVPVQKKNEEGLPHLYDSMIRPEVSALDWVYSTASWIGKSIYAFINS
jgi:hypothetical protein